MALIRYHASPLQTEPKIEALPGGLTVSEIVDRVCPPSLPRGLILVRVGGVDCPMEVWGRVKPKADVSIVAVPQSSVLNSITSFVANFTPIGWSVRALGWLGDQIWGFDLPDNPPRGSQAIDIRGARNREHPYGVIPTILGRHRVTPTLNSKSWSERVGNDLYRRFDLLVGAGPLRISDIRIGDTPIDQYPGVEVEILSGWNDDERMSLIPGVVIEDDVNVELKASDPPTVRTTAQSTDEISVDIIFPQGLVHFNSKGKQRDRRVQVRVEYKPASSAAGWVTAKTFDETRRTVDALRLGHVWRVPKGQYDVRLTRVTEDASSTSTRDVVYWSALRSILDEDTANHPYPCARIGVRILATDMAQGVLEQINCIAESYVLDWDDQSWIISRNPALLYRHWLRHWHLRRPVDDGRIDLAALQDWAARCAAQGWELNAVVDYEETVQDGLRRIAAAGRATPSWRDFKYSVVEDRPQTIVTGHVTPRNSRELSATRSFPIAIHGLKCRFISREAGFHRDEKIVYAEGYDESNATVFDVYEPWGIVEWSHVYAEAVYRLKKRELRREVWTVVMDWEHRTLPRGGLVKLSHDVLLVGLAWARVKGVDGDQVTLDCPVEVEEGRAYGLSVRTSTGGEMLLQVEASPGVTDTLTIIGSGRPGVGHLVTFGERGLENIEAIVQDVQPYGSDGEARVSLVAHAPEVHAHGAVPPYDPGVTLPPELEENPPEPPNIESVTTRQSGLYIGTESAEETSLMVAIAEPFGRVLVDRYEVQSRLVGYESWVRHPDSPGNRYLLEVWPVERGEKYDIRVRALNRAGKASGWALVEAVEVEFPVAMPVPDVRGLELYGQANNTDFAGRDAKFVWRESSVTEWVALGWDAAKLGARDLYFRDYEVTVHDIETGQIRRTEHVVDPEYTYTYERNVEDSKRLGLAGPRRRFRVEVVMRGRQSQVSRMPARIVVQNPAPELPAGWSLVPGYFEASAAFLIPDDTDFRRINVHLSTQQGFTPSAATLTWQGSDSPARIADLTQGATYYYRYQAEDAFGPGAMSGELSFTTKELQAQDISGLGPWAQIEDGDREQIEAWLAGEPDEFGEPLYQPRVVAGQIVSGVLQATTLIESEGLIRVKQGDYEITLGPQERQGALYALNAYDVDTNTLYTGIRADGRLYARGADIEGKVTITSGSTGYGNFDDAPESLADLDSAAATKLGGIAEGATRTTDTDQLNDGAGLGKTAEWNQVTGAGKPADNADQTKTVIDGGLITTGYIQLATDGNMRSGKENYADTASGWWLGNDAGQHKMALTNDEETKGFRFDGENLILLPETELVGADAFSNKNIYIHEYPTLGLITPSNYGNATSSYESAFGAVYMEARGNPSESSSTAIRAMGGGMVPFDWSKRRRWKAVAMISILTGSTNDSRVVLGQGHYDASFAGFILQPTGLSLVVRRHDGVQPIFMPVPTPWIGPSYVVFEIDINDEWCRFYVNDQLLGSIHSRPEEQVGQVSGAHRVLYAQALIQAGVPSNSFALLRISEYRFLQYP